MTTIVAKSQLTTVVTVFTVEPEHQQELVDILLDASRFIRRQPGFVSLNIHSSEDATHVMTYSQWQSREAFDDGVQNATVIPYVQAVLKLATFEPHFYEVVAVVHADEEA
jgi:quinol monooxygenase YgiN